MRSPSDNPVRIIAKAAHETHPQWAVLERQLIDHMNASPEPLLQKYVHKDGTLMWPTSPRFKSIDGLDDAYESFHNWPLFYALGGDAKFKDISLREWEAITEQFTHHDCGHGHPMVVKEYEEGYDWFHQGEGYLFFYMLGMADPANFLNKERAQRFAGFYMNEDPQAPNYDERLKLVRCAFVGSMGPAYRNFTRAAWGYADWKQWYGLPFQDVPGCPDLESIHVTRSALNMARVMKQRMSKGDVATNLAITGMVTHAYLYSGETRYKDWVKDYVDAWTRRAADNGGIIPDNIGLSGRIGETMNGKWYGGYYGWTWPHGWLSLGDAITVAGETAFLLHRDARYLDLPRSQMDILIGKGIQSEGTLYVPYKYGDPGNYEYNLGDKDVLTADTVKNPVNNYSHLMWKEGWFEFQPMKSSHAVHIWHLTQESSDLARIKRIRNNRTHDWEKVVDTNEKDQGGHDSAWASFLCGEYPAYPEDILRYNLFQVDRRLAFMREDTQDPKTYGDYYLQVRNPITCEGLVQLTLGAPLPLYNGGLLMASLRYYDREQKRPGLPQDVAALVKQIEQNSVVVHLVNLNRTQARLLIIQGGAYGEHQITRVSFVTQDKDDQKTTKLDINSRYFELDLLPQAEITLEIGLQRFAHDPSYQLQWR